LFSASGLKIRILFLFLFFSALLVPSVNAEVIVSVQPVDERDFFYSEEVREFRAVVLNPTNDRETGYQFKAEVSSDLVLLEQNKEVSEIFFTLPEVLPGRFVALPFWVKARGSLSDSAVITLNFGKTVFSEFSARSTRVVASPLTVAASLQKERMGLSEDNSILLSVRNDSNKVIENFSAQLVLNPSFLQLSPRVLQIEKLDSNSGLEPFEFGFVSKGNVLGTFDAVVGVDFSDETGQHILDKRFEVEVSDTSLATVLLVVVIVALIGIMAFLRPKPIAEKKTVHPQKEDKKENAKKEK